LEDPVWIRVSSLSVILLFIFLADAILSYWVPNFLEYTYNNTSTVGLIMAFSSIAGLSVDLIFPQILKQVTVKKLILFAITASFIFSGSLLGSTYAPYLLLILFGMVVWGIYYELLIFAQQQFVSDSTPLRYHSGVWGIIGVFRAFAYFLGPIIAGEIVPVEGKYALYLALIFALISFITLSFFHKTHDRVLSIEVDKVNIFKEFEHWVVLFEHVWPIIIMSIILGIIDATFWSVGAIWNETLSESHPIGGLFLSSYILPSMFIGFVIARFSIYKGKKKLAEKFMLFSGLLFAALGLNSGAYWQVSFVFFASIFLSASYPLLEGVYSDIIARMGRERKHMIGLFASTSSVAYIVGPPLAGVIADFVGEQLTFVVLGISTIIISAVLLIVTPKKLLLPQEEIQRWKD